MMRSPRLSIIGVIISVVSLLPVMTQATEPIQFDYMMHCQGCHLPEGQGFPLRDVPRIKNHLGKFLHVEGGREFLIQVPGSAQSDLNDSRLTAVINWMLITFSQTELPDNFQPYTVTEVSRLRRSPLVEVKSTRALLIKKIEKLKL
ncbi:cytochrome C [Aestuariicella sp. G3-2]|uniref:cytochrome C n=1 Tax=Pseudomaricurvus albidus TaxID=2842452 RepID=UPI001C0B62D1|nr:cytochrome C [Aestuariicella albida]MBU3071291.1 cytochrome C [Aestuariicella albida]